MYTKQKIKQTLEDTLLCDINSGNTDTATVEVDPELYEIIINMYIENVMANLDR